MTAPHFRLEVNDNYMNVRLTSRRLRLLNFSWCRNAIDPSLVSLLRGACLPSSFIAPWTTAAAPTNPGRLSSISVARASSASIAPLRNFSSGHGPTPSNHHLKDLSDEQLTAVKAPVGPVRIVAGPGSGKTRVLAARIAHLIKDHSVPPWQIVAITFTNKAAAEVRDRLETAVGDAALELFAGTFHSLCYRILRRSLPQSFQESGRSTDWSLYDQDAAFAVVYKLVKAAHPEMPTTGARESARQIQSRISRVKNTMQTWYGRDPSVAVLEHLLAMTYGTRKEVQAAYARELAEWFTAYEFAMREANALDFDDLLVLTVEMLRRREDLRTRLKRRWRHLLVDEFQDTNCLQYELIKLLTDAEEANMPSLQEKSSSASVFIVGDQDQAIYGWRGADVDNMRRRFLLDFPTCRVFRLRDNYRSTKDIVSVAQSVITRVVDPERLALRARRGSESVPVRVCEFENAYVEAEYVAQEASEIIQSGVHRDRDIAVLFRTHQQTRIVEQELLRRGIRYVLIGGLQFWRRTEVHDVLAYLRLAVTMNDDVALRRTINTPKRGLGDATMNKLNLAAASKGLKGLCELLWGGEDKIRAYVEHLSPLSLFSNEDDVISGLIPVLPPAKEMGLSAKAMASVEDFRRIIARARVTLIKYSLPAATRGIIDETKYEDHVRSGGCGGNEDDVGDRLSRLQSLVDLAARFVPGSVPGPATIDAALDDDENVVVSTRTVSERTALDGTSVQDAVVVASRNVPAGTGLDSARAFLDEAALSSGMDDDADVDGVRLMTMHAAKGLEFDVVFVPGCVEGLIPLMPSSDNAEKELEEETRLFFVSMTRAKKDLRLLHTRIHAIHGEANRRPNKPSRFLKDVMRSGHAIEAKHGSRDYAPNTVPRKSRYENSGSAASKGREATKAGNVPSERSNSSQRLGGLARQQQAKRAGRR